MVGRRFKEACDACHRKPDKITALACAACKKTVDDRAAQRKRRKRLQQQKSGAVRQSASRTSNNDQTDDEPDHIAEAYQLIQDAISQFPAQEECPPVLRALKHRLDEVLGYAHSVDPFVEGVAREEDVVAAANPPNGGDDWLDKMRAGHGAETQSRAPPTSEFGHVSESPVFGQGHKCCDMPVNASGLNTGPAFYASNTAEPSRQRPSMITEGGSFGFVPVNRSGYVQQIAETNRVQCTINYRQNIPEDFSEPSRAASYTSSVVAGTVFRQPFHAVYTALPHNLVTIVEDDSRFPTKNFTGFLLKISELHQKAAEALYNLQQEGIFLPYLGPDNFLFDGAR